MNKNRKIKVYIDLGHGGHDSGAINKAHRESDRVLIVGLKVRAKLEKTGKFEVRMSRDNDTYRSLQQRTDDANNWGADIFISIHCNSSTNKNANGVETYCLNFKYRKLADHINNGILQCMELRNRGVKEGNYHVVRETNMSACLTELAFMSNDGDLLKLLHEIEGFANGIFKGVMDYYHFEVEENNNDCDQLYIVGVGAFNDINNARELMNKYKNEGKDAYIHIC